MTSKIGWPAPKILRNLAMTAGAIVVVFTGFIAWASLTEPRALVGDAHDADPTVRAYASAETRLFDRFGVPAHARTLTLRDPAIRVHVLEVPGEDPPVLMIHGGGSTSASWMPLLPHLRGRHLFLVDRPGCGLTDGFDNVDVDLRHHAVAFVGGVLDGLGVKHAALIGNSMGGLWSLWYAIEHPERVDALAMAGCPALFPGTSAPTGMRLMALPGVGQAMMRMQPKGVSGARQGFARAAGEHAASLVDDELLATANLGRLIPGAMRSFRTLAAALTLSGPNSDYAFTESDLARVRAPLLLVWGRDDVFGAPSAAEHAKANHPEIALEIVPGGHLPWIDEPERCGRAIRTFLDGHAPLEARAAGGTASEP
jgi:pimeloyl-ACP methyl ester carboxylesterase